MQAGYDSPPVPNLMRELAAHPETPRQCRILARWSRIAAEDAAVRVTIPWQGTWECWLLDPAVRGRLVRMAPFTSLVVLS